MAKFKTEAQELLGSLLEQQQKLSLQMRETAVLLSLANARNRGYINYRHGEITRALDIKNGEIAAIAEMVRQENLEFEQPRQVCFEMPPAPLVKFAGIDFVIGNRIVTDGEFYHLQPVGEVSCETAHGNMFEKVA